MNRIPRPGDALGIRLRNLGSSTKAALAGLSALTGRVQALEARVAELEARADAPANDDREEP